jgi:hypothetical protein
MKTRYIIVGDNNFWFATVTVSSQAELNNEIESIRKGIKHGDFNLEMDNKPTELIAIQLSDSKSNDIVFNY